MRGSAVRSCQWSVWLLQRATRPFFGCWQMITMEGDLLFVLGFGGRCRVTLCGGRVGMQSEMMSGAPRYIGFA